MISYDNEFEEMIMDCDACSASQTFEGDWQACINEAKFEGWFIVSAGGNDWKHYCPDCKP